MQDLTIIMPSYNEYDSLITYLPDVINFCKINSCSLVLVDDGSNDKTQEFINAANFSYSKFIYLKHNVNKGYGAAIKSGIINSKTKYVVTIDSDGQHLLDDVKRLYLLIKEKNADMIVGKRPNEKKSYYRNIGKFFIRKFVFTLFGNKIIDINSGMKMYKNDLALKYLHLCPDGMPYSDTILLIFLNFKYYVIEEKINLNKRETGNSTISTKTAFETVLQILNIAVLFKPLKVFITLSIFILLVSFSWGLPILIEGKGLSVGSLLGILTSILIFILGLLVEQITQIRKNLK